jgi:hypothetical protein
MLPEQARADLDRDALETGEAEIPVAALDAPEDVLAEHDAEVRALREEPFDDAERPAGIDDLKAKYDNA